MGFLDDVRAVLGAGADEATNVVSRIRYGVDSPTKDAMMYGRQLPGAPAYTEDPAAAERYASAYLGARKWGRTPAELFNAVALSDLTKSRGGAERAKAAGAMGAQAGEEAAQAEEDRRRQRLAALFRGERTG